MKYICICLFISVYLSYRLLVMKYICIYLYISIYILYSLLVMKYILISIYIYLTFISTISLNIDSWKDQGLLLQRRDQGLLCYIKY